MARHFRFAVGKAQGSAQDAEIQADAARRLIRQIERAIADFDRTVNDLNRGIETEQIRTRIDNPSHFAYSTAAQEMIRRRSNLIQSIDRLNRQLADVKTTLQPTTASLPAAAMTDSTSTAQ